MSGFQGSGWPYAMAGELPNYSKQDHLSLGQLSLLILFVFEACHRWACRPSDVRCREKVEDRLAAPLIGEQLRNLGTIPTGVVGVGAVTATGWR